MSTIMLMAVDLCALMRLLLVLTTDNLVLMMHYDYILIIIQRLNMIENVMSTANNLVVEGTATLHTAHVKSVKFYEDKGGNARVAFALDAAIPRYVFNEAEGKYVKGEMNVTNTFLSQFKQLLAADEDFAGLEKLFADSEALTNRVFVHAELTICCQSVKGNETYTNPFVQNGKERVIDHDTIIAHVIGFRLTPKGYQRLEKADDTLFEVSVKNHICK